MFIFWDNSNIHYSGLESVYPIFEPGKPREIYRTYFKNLLMGHTQQEVYHLLRMNYGCICKTSELI